MDIAALLQDFAFSKYESSCYLTLVANHPSNGSRLSRLSGISRSRIYDVLRSLGRKGLVFEIEKGQYVPLPFDELKKQLRGRFESNLTALEEQLKRMGRETEYDYLLTMHDYRAVVAKARDIIDGAQKELYLRLFPETWQRVQSHIARAHARGVGLRCISMGPMPLIYDIQVLHPQRDDLMEKIGGESIDIVADRTEALSGILAGGSTDPTSIIWTRNQSFIISTRDSLRHDFYHYFLELIHEQGRPLSARDKRIYAFIKGDD